MTAELTYLHFDQHYSKKISWNSISQNLQRAEELVISCLIDLAIAYHALSASFNVSVIVNFKNSPTNEFLTIEVFHITNKINEFSTDMRFKLLTISKMKYKSNHLYLKMTLILSGDINLFPGPVTRNQINNPKFHTYHTS